MDSGAKSVKNIAKKRVSAVKFITVTASLSAISIVLQFLEIPIFPAFPFLRLDFSSVPSLIGGFMLGPFVAGGVEVIKVLFMLLKTYTFGIGELSNLICSLAFVLPPAVIYLFRKNLKHAFAGLAAGVAMEVLISALSNYFIIFPMYINIMGFDFLNGMTLGTVILTVVVPFNVIKTLAVSVVVLLLYKPVSRGVKKFLR